MGATMESFIVALEAVEQKDFNWWKIRSKSFNEDDPINSRENYLTSCFTLAPIMDEFTTCNNKMSRVSMKIQQLEEEPPPLPRAVHSKNFPEANQLMAGPY